MEPLGERALHVGDIVLVRVHGHEYLHLVKAIQGTEGHARYLIGNNRGGIDGWVGRRAIAGIATKIVRP